MNINGIIVVCGYNVAWPSIACTVLCHCWLGLLVPYYQLHPPQVALHAVCGCSTSEYFL